MNILYFPDLFLFKLFFWWFSSTVFLPSNSYKISWFIFIWKHNIDLVLFKIFSYYHRFSSFLLWFYTMMLKYWNKFVFFQFNINLFLFPNSPWPLLIFLLTFNKIINHEPSYSSFWFYWIFNKSPQFCCCSFIITEVV